MKSNVWACKTCIAALPLFLLLAGACGSSDDSAAPPETMMTDDAVTLTRCADGVFVHHRSGVRHCKHLFRRALRPCFDGKE